MTEPEKLLTIPNHPLSKKLGEFAELMLEKFYLRVAKHPGEESVTDKNYNWAGTNLTDIEHHLICEFVERFPQYRDRFPELAQADVTLDGEQKEDIDIANLAFVDWAVREARKHTNPRDKP